MIRIALLLIVAAQGTWGAEFCSLKVTLTDDSGTGVAQPITVAESNGRKTTRMSNSGEVEFCELGILPVTITVGRDSCKRVTVSDVPLYWGSTQNVAVFYDDKACRTRLEVPFLAVCEILLRIQNSDGTPVRNAILDLKDASFTELASDNFGRILLRHTWATLLQGSVKADGHSDFPVTLACDRQHQKYELVAILKIR